MHYEPLDNEMRFPVDPLSHRESLHLLIAGKTYKTLRVLPFCDYSLVSTKEIIETTSEYRASAMRARLKDKLAFP